LLRGGGRRLPDRRGASSKLLTAMRLAGRRPLRSRCRRAGWLLFGGDCTTDADGAWERLFARCPPAPQERGPALRRRCARPLRDRPDDCSRRMRSSRRRRRSAEPDARVWAKARASSGRGSDKSGRVLSGRAAVGSARPRVRVAGACFHAKAHPPSTVPVRRFGELCLGQRLALVGVRQSSASRDDPGARGVATSIGVWRSSSSLRDSESGAAQSDALRTV
jgi:hypothetical protein